MDISEFVEEVMSQVDDVIAPPMTQEDALDALSELHTGIESRMEAINSDIAHGRG